ncbi:tRNA (adenosine(37)-N6)-dimethylallyltransferase MiaA [Sulfitobacter aestuariivivens]|uniref:tRNA dimethylallyltransferase n=1 Tax=Sulfitobacter aestuariivivens TaxID=2766981 RepID=A0A927D121_9RHOB|nr:tRNA (adenosine(37)-N6)-dimethylallyltransferase MiaA [Sulfitobacter aestuariivivens]MBD3663108.1 tRNA (adenosine(37)-N6)-dimethylallyltransferase MiaA [Sulfitobacter aestuariivivens]
MPIAAAFENVLRNLSAEQPVLIAGPTASGKSALALEIADRQGGVIVNADASQVYDCWRVITARPSAEEEAAAPHALYGYIAATSPYSTGHWLRDVTPVLTAGVRPIITGGTGLYFSALTRGLAEIPATPTEVRAQADLLPVGDLAVALDPKTISRIDMKNRARVQRAWEVQQATGRGLADWQDDTGPPILPISRTYPIVFDVEKDWLNDRIARRFDLMLKAGALEEIRAVAPYYDPALPAHRAIGVPELVSYLKNETSLEDARGAAIIATRQFAKRQRTWMRSKMSDWNAIFCP